MKKQAVFASLAALGIFLASASVRAEPTLKDAFKNDFFVGVALNNSQFTGQNPREDALIKAQFNSISPENCLKWDATQPRRFGFTFKSADRYVAFGQRNGMFIIGHTLVWRYQTPKWVFYKFNYGRTVECKRRLVGRKALLARMRYHIFKVVGRYKGKIGGWDVVNEALNDEGTLRKSLWEKIIGPDYIIKAYQYAHEADPHAQLYYNDYSLENVRKRKGAIALIKKLQAAGIPIAGVGMQGHYKLNWPSTNQIDRTIKDFSKLGVKVMFTELDLDVLPLATRSEAAELSLNFALRARLNPWTNGLPASVEQKEAKRYADLFKIFVANKNTVSRVTFWGVTDGDSWLNNWPVIGRTAYPLLFNRNYKPKPDFYSVIKVAEEQSATK